MITISGKQHVVQSDRPIRTDPAEHAGGSRSCKKDMSKNDNPKNKKIKNASVNGSQKTMTDETEAAENIGNAADMGSNDTKTEEKTVNDKRRIKFEQSTSEYTERRRKMQADWDIRPYLAIGAIVFLVFCCCMAVIFIVFRYDKIQSLFGKLSGILTPVFIGLVVGYLLNPLMEKIERLLLTAFLPKTKDEAKTRKRIRTLSAIATVIFFLIIIGAIIALLIPALITSITSFVNSLSGYIEKYDEIVEGLNVSDNIKSQLINVEHTIYDITDDIYAWVIENVLPRAQKYVVTVGSGLMSVLVAVKNVVIGLIVAIYVLCEKDHFEGQGKRVVYAFLPVNQANKVVAFIHKCNNIFGGFIVGKVLDSVIIGLITFIFCTCVQMPYTLLISVVIGVTNIVPFFGPFVGGVPSFILVLLVSPWHGIVFGIFILVLQQVDGNIIGPKILGDSTGLSSFWVIVAILLGGGLWGFMGMVFGVPMFAVLYYLATLLVKHMTEKRGMPEQSREYTFVKKVDEKTGELINDDDRIERTKGFDLKAPKKIVKSR